MPVNLLLRAKRILGRMVSGSSLHETGGPTPDPLRRRNQNSELGPLSEEYFSRQIELVRDRLIAEIRCNPSADLGLLLADPDYATVGERVVEYGWIARKLLANQATSRKPRLLDVGCVLNNPIVTDVVRECCSSIWLMNPSPEPWAYTERAAYVLADPRKHFLTPRETFSRVTCFSTLEHVGMNNLRYGGDAGSVTRDTEHPEEHAMQSLLSLWDLTAAGGELSLSVPFGPFEYLYVPGDSRPIYYTFDRQRLLKLFSAVPVPASEWSIEIWKVVPQRGWVQSGLDDAEILPHATNCAGAGAVAIASIIKPH